MSPKSLPYISDFIRGIHEAGTPGVPENRTAFFIFREGEGTLFLDQHQAVAYSDAVGRLVNDFARDEDLSRRSIERYLQEALFKVLDIPGSRHDSFHKRLHKTLAELLKRLGSPPISYRCFVPIRGLAVTDLPLTFGGVRFVRFGRSQERELSSSPFGRSQANGFSDVVRRLRHENIWGTPCAVLAVQARDLEAAKLRARSAARATVDCINFFRYLIPYNHGWLYLPSEAAQEIEILPTVSSDGRRSIAHSRVGPSTSFSIQNLREHQSVLRHWKAVSELARTCKSKTAGEVILTSVRWTGRANVEPKRELSFLLFAIALEAVMLPTYAQELTYRLSLRVAKLLGGDRYQKIEVVRTIRSLYSVRSNIVHSGSYSVTDEELRRLQWLTTRVLLRLLHKRKIWQRSTKDLDVWLEELGVS